jgi:hypothetical protein
MHKVAEKKVSRPSAHEQEVERLKAAVEMRDREIEWLKTKPAEDGSLFDIAKTSLTRSLASFSNTSDWQGPETSATR